MLTGCTPWPAEFEERYRQAGYWTGDTLGALPAVWAARFGARTAVVAGSDRWSYRDLHERSGRLAGAFRALGVGPADRAVVNLPNGSDFLETLFALFAVGAVPLLAPIGLPDAEVAALCGQVDASVLVADRPRAKAAQELASLARRAAPGLRQVVVTREAGGLVDLHLLRSVWPRRIEEDFVADPGDVALLHVSSGTTGTPRVIPRTHVDYLCGARASAERARFDADTVFLCSLPAAHQFSLAAPGILATLLHGGRVVLAPHPAPDVVFPLVERERVRVAAVVPSVLAVWLQAPTRTRYDLSSLQVVQVGGARLDPEVARRARPGLGAQLQQVFGMTEGLLCMTGLDEPDGVVHETQGRPVSPGDEIRIVDDHDQPVTPGRPGHLLARGPYTIRGYWQAPEENAARWTADGWFRTGDIVREEPTGHLVVVGRSTDLINRGGLKVAAVEIEQHLLACPGIGEAAVVAMPDAYLGEAVCAYIVADSADVVEALAVKAFLRGRGLASHQVPDRIQVVEELPRTPTGKVAKAALRERIAEQVQASGGIR